MAAQAVIEIRNTFLAVFLLGFGAVMTGVARPLRQGGLVTVSAGVVFLAMIHGESMRSIVRGWPPGGGGMAF